jgi:CRP-like cAMP-binding protein
MTNPLVRKLEQFTRLSEADCAILNGIITQRVRHVAAGADLIREGDQPRDVNLFLTGWACRYKQLEDGRRQIVAFFLPGDLCDHNVFILREMDHSISALTPITVAELSRDAFERITLDHPRITQALWWETLVNAAVQREWTVNLGQRDAAERMAHLLCELFLRLRGVGLTEGDSCAFPLTQSDLAGATGMSVVHVNRTLQELRGRDLLTLKSRRLTIPDLDAMMRAGLFNPNYLHLDREGARFDANGH